jgi:hypothetical protein
VSLGWRLGGGCTHRRREENSRERGQVYTAPLQAWGELQIGVRLGKGERGKLLATTGRWCRGCLCYDRALVRGAVRLSGTVLPSTHEALGLIPSTAKR